MFAQLIDAVFKDICILSKKDQPQRYELTTLRIQITANSQHHCAVVCSPRHSETFRLRRSTPNRLSRTMKDSLSLRFNNWNEMCFAYGLMHQIVIAASVCSPSFSVLVQLP